MRSYTQRSTHFVILQVLWKVQKKVVSMISTKIVILHRIAGRKKTY